MKKITFLILLIFLGNSLIAQDKEKDLKFSIQTDLVSYLNSGGYSVWLGGQKKLNQILLAFENRPNIEKSYYYDTGIRENEKTLRLVLSRFIGSEKWYKNFFYGINLEYRWGNLEEIVTREQENTENFRIGTTLGYKWIPWQKKSNWLKSIGITPWVNANYRLNNNNQTTIFEITQRVHDNQDDFYFPLGLNISFTFHKN